MGTMSRGMFVGFRGVRTLQIEFGVARCAKEQSIVMRALQRLLDGTRRMLEAINRRTSRMGEEVSEMIALRHSAEQRANYSPLGRLICLNTEHGRIEFPAEDGEFTGPDVATVNKEDLIESAGGDPNLQQFMSDKDNPYLLLLGPWCGLPGLRKLTNEPCPHCRHDCDICGGTGKIVCNGMNCGGQGWVPGPWLPCPGDGCSKETGNFNPSCRTCNGSGQVPEHSPCPMCNGTKETVCQRCRGKLEFSTGKLNGSIDWTGPRCPHCEGNGYRFEMQAQDLKRFTNATLRQSKIKNVPARDFLVLGPIHSFELMHFATSRAQTYDVTPDAAGDFLVLLVPKNLETRFPKAYLVGGVVREREVRTAVGA